MIALADEVKTFFSLANDAPGGVDIPFGQVVDPRGTLETRQRRLVYPHLERIYNNNLH